MMDELVEGGMRKCGPIYVILAIALILTVTYTYFCILLIESRQISPVVGGTIVVHKILGFLLLALVMFNYWMCVTTKPGSTLDVDRSVLYSHSEKSRWRFCKTCDLPKPDLTHHCTVCKKCIMKMDHHCPWVGNCVGFRNYRYFYLFLFYLTISAFYAFCLMFKYRKIFLHRHAGEILPVLSLTLSGTIGFAVAALLGWHTFLIGTAQGTIDFMSNYMAWKSARKQGQRWKNPHDKGFFKNFKIVFDVDGRFWWILWLLPTVKEKEGSGLCSVYTSEDFQV